MPWFPTLLLLALSLLLTRVGAEAAEPVPDQLVVLTFDDSVASHHSVVRPLLKRLGFGATFIIVLSESLKSTLSTNGLTGASFGAAVAAAADPPSSPAAASPAVERI